MELFAACRRVLFAVSIEEKQGELGAIEAHIASGALDRRSHAAPPATYGRPAQPRLVHPAQVPRRGVGTPHGRAATLHAIAHIEFNAIHLALDASVRFPTMPDAYHRDWIGVAIEEARHFEMLAAALGRRGYGYGSFDAHDGLWEIATRTADDVLARMAIVPRIIEARGLDVTPGLRARFAQAGDHEATAILDVILADEIGHVACGNRWYRYECARRGVDPAATAQSLALRYNAPRAHPPFNLDARRASGFSEAEVAALAGAAGVTDSRDAG